MKVHFWDYESEPGDDWDGKVGVAQFVILHENLERQIQNGAFARAQIGLQLVGGDLIGDERILGIDAQNRTVRHDAEVTMIRRIRHHDNHFAFRLRQSAFPLNALGFTYGWETLPFGLNGANYYVRGKLTF